MNFHIGTATGMGGGGAQPTGPHMGGAQGIIGGAGYCILTSIDGRQSSAVSSSS